MDFILDQSMADLGVTDVITAKVWNVDVHAELTDDFRAKQAKWLQWALDVDPDTLADNRIIKGYNDLTASVGRSLRKNPPTAIALINNVKRRGSMPHVNSVVDIYNVETLISYEAIGCHDLDVIDWPIEYTVHGREDTFTPIMANPKRVAETDFVYRDRKGIMAYLDTRDADAYKLTDDTKNVLFCFVGNPATTVEERLEELRRVLADLKACMPELTYEIHHVSVGADEVVERG